MRPGWNLVSLPLPAVSPEPATLLASLEGSGVLVSVWTYDRDTGWACYPAGAPVAPPRLLVLPLRDQIQGKHALAPPPAPGSPAELSRLEYGRGYFFHLKPSTDRETGILRYEASYRASSTALRAGWNLVGFGTASASVEQLLHDDRGALYTCIGDRDSWPLLWRFDAQALQYETPGQASSFDRVQAGLGYWLPLQADTELVPQLALELEPDTEDSNLNGNGRMEDEHEQNTLDLGADRTHVRFVLANDGNGALSYVVRFGRSWRAAPGDRPTIGAVPEDYGWTAWQAPHTWLQLEPAAGALPRGSRGGDRQRELELRVGRAQLPRGHLLVELEVASTGGSRKIYATLEVPNLDGRYAGQVTLERIGGCAHGLFDFALAISLSEHHGQLLGGIADTAALLFPQEIGFIGACERAGRWPNIELFGSYALAPDDPINPFPVRIVREVALVGREEEPGLLVGRYVENLHGVGPDPVVAEGRFRLRRQALDPGWLPEVAGLRCQVHGVEDGVVAHLTLTGNGLHETSRVEMGQLDWENLVPGIYQIRASAPGYRDAGQATAEVELRAEAEPQTVRLQLERVADKEDP